MLLISFFLHCILFVECRCCIQADEEFVITKSWAHWAGCSIPNFKRRVQRPLGYPGAKVSFRFIRWSVVRSNVAAPTTSSHIYVETFLKSLDFCESWCENVVGLSSSSSSQQHQQPAPPQMPTPRTSFPLVRSCRTGTNAAKPFGHDCSGRYLNHSIEEVKIFPKLKNDKQFEQTEPAKKCNYSFAKLLIALK